MANEEQLSILKQGVQAWNRWRRKNPNIPINLYNADLRGVRLKEDAIGDEDLGEDPFGRINFSNANLVEANLNNAYLLGAILFDANLKRANLSRANLNAALLGHAILRQANLKHTSLRGVELNGAVLMGADLSGSDLTDAFLGEANLTGAILAKSKFSMAVVQNTIFGNSDLSDVIGLEDVVHGGPSSISTDTFARSKGKIPETFLRGCGLSDTDIEYAKLANPDLSNDEINKILYKMYDLRATQAIQIAPLYISYSHADHSFVDKMEVHLKEKGIRFWRDIHELKAGRMEKQFDRAMRQNPTVLLILSAHSIGSDWVEHEVRLARGLEKETGQDVLCPIALDASWKDSHWPKRIMEQIMEYNILDFSAWEDDSKFEGMFRKLIDGLELFYKG
ncbi:MAG: toll/interleukin-1 receptor domain-containing protein [Anaerolineales bacterium]